jgi:hypothetical protein
MLLPNQHLVTEAGSIGNDSPAFLSPPRTTTQTQVIVLKEFIKTGTASALSLAQQQ